VDPIVDPIHDPIHDGIVDSIHEFIGIDRIMDSDEIVDGIWNSSRIPVYKLPFKLPPWSAFEYTLQTFCGW
jgi:hypothetical protein